MQKTTIAAVIILTAGALFSQDRFDMKVRNYFFAGLAGDTSSLQKGMKICEDILARDPKQPEALVWHGMGLVQQSQEAFQKGDQQNGAVLWQRGLDEMDQAETIAPNDLGVRIVRGAVLLVASQYLPTEAAHPLIEKGLSDYEKAYSVQGPDLSHLGTHKSGELMIGMADAYARLGQARQSAAVVRAHSEGSARHALRQLSSGVVGNQDPRASPSRLPELPHERK